MKNQTRFLTEYTDQCSVRCTVCTAVHTIHCSHQLVQYQNLQDYVIDTKKQSISPQRIIGILDTKMTDLFSNFQSNQLNNE